MGINPIESENPMLFKKKTKTTDIGKIPVHIAIIMDGNGRWAKKRGLSRSFGHSEGAATLKKIAKYCDKIGVKYLTVYAFSTENWKRSKAEIDALMKLFDKYLDEIINDYKKQNSKIVFLGDRSILKPSLVSKIERAEMESKDRTGFQLNVALNYGGRQEITYAAKCIAKKVIEEQLKLEDIDETEFSDNLFTKGIPDPDIIIRPSGEMRISNFLLWQSAYSEFWYNTILWPDFKEEHLNQAIIDFNKRNRRYGG